MICQILWGMSFIMSLETELSSNADKKIVNAILFVCDKLKGEGNSESRLIVLLLPCE